MSAPAALPVPFESWSPVRIKELPGAPERVHSAIVGVPEAADPGETGGANISQPTGAVGAGFGCDGLGMSGRIGDGATADCTAVCGAME